MVAENPNPAGTGQNVFSRGAESSTRVSPEANTAVGNSRVLIADGTSLTQGAAASETRWFTFGAEAGKTYTVEVLNPYGDLSFNAIGTVGIFNGDGTTAPTEASVNCAMSTVAPSLEVSSDGIRCVIRMFVPTSSTTLNKRAVFISVDNLYTPGFTIRVRESTIYGRWTTNGYDFHVELQNTTTDTVCVQLVRYPGTGTTPPTGNLLTSNSTIPPMGAAKQVFANGSLVDPVHDVPTTRAPARGLCIAEWPADRPANG